MSPKGSDGNGDGNAGNPYQTLSFAATKVQDSDGTIVLMGNDGEFKGANNVGITLRNSKLNISSNTNATIDCQNQNGLTGLQLVTNGSSETWIQGITFRRCDQALRLQNASASLHSCRFENNFRRQQSSFQPLNGSAIQVNEGSLDVFDTVFLNNDASTGYGGAIYASAASVTVTRGNLTGNSACRGGAVALTR